MSRDGIEAYDVAKRITSYDADMDVMHPNRHRMIDIALEVLPFGPQQEFCVLDLGVGTGFFTTRLLGAYPRARVLAVDGARKMVEIATARLGAHRSRVEFRIGDFRDLDALLSSSDRGQVVVSSYALHHLHPDEKTAVVRRCVDFLEPEGWLLNADVIVAGAPPLESRYQDLRVEGIVRRSPDGDQRFCDPARARSHLDQMEAAEGDHPLTLQEDVDILRRAGLRHVGVVWLEYREAVMGGIK
jgi:SAM-dependent methyltransferase